MKIINCEQRSPEWFRARCGFITSSRIADVLAKLRSGGEAAGRRNYRAQLVCERLTGEPAEDTYCNADMQRGIDMEPIARAAYEVHREVFVEQCGFILHPSLPLCGASVDGLVGDDGLVEIKCPRLVTHLDYLLHPEQVPSEYQPQMLWQMECTGRNWCDFVSYDPRMPKRHRLFVRRLMRDEKRLKEMREEVERFLLEVEMILKQLDAPNTLQDQDRELLERKQAEIEASRPKPMGAETVTGKDSAPETPALPTSSDGPKSSEQADQVEINGQQITVPF